MQIYDDQGGPAPGGDPGSVARPRWRPWTIWDELRSLARSDRPFLEDRQRHLLAYAGFAGVPGENDWILVTGIHLDESFYTRLDDLSEGVSFYRRVPTLITVRQGQVLFSQALVVLLLAIASVFIARRLAGRVSRTGSNPVGGAKSFKTNLTCCENYSSSGGKESSTAVPGPLCGITRALPPKLSATWRTIDSPNPEPG